MMKKKRSGDAASSPPSDLRRRAEAALRAQQALEASRQKYFDLYDFAPVGYFALNEKGLILEANLTAAALLGVERARLIKQPFTRFIAKEDEDIYYLYRKKLTKARTRQECELRMTRNAGSTFWVRIAAGLTQESVGDAVACRLTISDINESTVALKQAAQEWQKTFDSISDSIAIIDSEYRIVKANAAMTRLLDKTSKDIIGEKCYRLFHGTDVPIDNCPCKRMQQTKKREESECYFADKGMWINVAVDPVCDEDGTINKAVHIAKDITERKRIEEALRGKTEFLNTVFAAIPHPLYVLDAKTYEIVQANAATNVMLKPGDTCYAVTHHRNEPCTGEHACPLWEVKKTGQAVTTEHIHLDNNGNQQYHEVHGFPLFDARRNITHMIEFVLDITEQKKSDIAARQAEQKFHAIFDNASDGILIADVETKRFYLANAKIAQMLGYSSEELTKLSVRDIHPEKDLAAVVGAFEKQTRKEKGVAFDLPVRRKDGTFFYADINSMPIELQGKKYLLGVFRDATERRAREKALIEAKNAAEVANVAKSEFLANISHELRTPLNSVLGFSDVLLDQLYGALTEKQKKYLVLIRDSGVRLLGLIDTIVDLSKFEAGDVPLQLQRFLVKDVLDGCLLLVKERAMRHAIVLLRDVPDDVGEIEADKTRFRQVVAILLVNAVKFTPDGGQAGIRVQRLENEVRIAVWDTGVGISSEDMLRLFQPLTPLDASITKEYGGLGASLMLAKKIVELHGGTIRVESEGKGKGTTVTFTIPLKT